MAEQIRAEDIQRACSLMRVRADCDYPACSEDGNSCHMAMALAEYRAALLTRGWVPPEGK